LRKDLEKFHEQRKRFTGTFEEFGKKRGWKGRTAITVLLVDIKDSTGKVVTDHLWMNHTKGFQALGDLQEGDVIAFDARVKTYWKGYMGHRDDLEHERPIEQDYKLSHPNNFRIIKKQLVLSPI